MFFVVVVVVVVAIQELIQRKLQDTLITRSNTNKDAASSSSLRKQQQQIPQDRNLFVSSADAIGFLPLGDAFGSNVGNVATNADGTVVAAGGHSLLDGSTVPVQVYRVSSDPLAWTPLGSAIAVTNSNSKSTEVTLNDDGTVLAITQIDGTNSVGTVQVYNLINDNDWSPVGSSIDAGTLEVLSVSTALNADGTVLAVGKSNMGNAGVVEVYQRSGSEYVLRDTVVDPQGSTQTGQNFGQYVSLNDAGDVLAVGAPFATSSNGHVSAGVARVYSYTDGGSYQQVGSDLEGQDESEICGVVSLNGDGSIVAVGSWNQVSDTGFQTIVRVYQQNVDGSWVARGRTIVSSEEVDFPLYQLDLDNAGDRLVFTNLDYAHVYDFGDTAWVAVYDTPHLTSAIALNKAGKRIVTTSYPSGTVRVLRQDETGRQDNDGEQYFHEDCTEPVPFGYRFLSRVDSEYQDYTFLDATTSSVADMAASCDGTDECVGFNSEGHMKMALRSPSDQRYLTNHYTDKCDGLFVRLLCVPARVPGCDGLQIPCGYRFVPQKKLLVYTYNPLPLDQDVFEYAAYCDSDPQCAGFDSSGTTKRKIPENQLIDWTLSGQCWGTFIKEP